MDLQSITKQHRDILYIMTEDDPFLSDYNFELIQVLCLLFAHLHFENWPQNLNGLHKNKAVKFSQAV